MVGSVMQTIAKQARPTAVQDFTGPAQPLILGDKREFPASAKKRPRRVECQHAPPATGLLNVALNIPT